MAGGVEDADRLAEPVRPGEELEVVLVGREDQHLAGGSGRVGEGGDGVVRLGVLAFEPGDGEQVEAGLNVGQRFERPAGLLVSRPVGFVGRICGLAAGGAVLTVEDDKDLRPAGELGGDRLA